MNKSSWNRHDPVVYFQSKREGHIRGEVCKLKSASLVSNHETREGLKRNETPTAKETRQEGILKKDYCNTPESRTMLNVLRTHASSKDVFVFPRCLVAARKRGLVS